MEIRNKEERHRRRVSIVLIITVVLLIVLVGMLIYESKTSSPQLSAYSDDWNDISDFKGELENYEGNYFTTKTMISSPALLDDIADPTDMAYVAIGIEKMYLDNEAKAIRDFVDRGGKVLIADDFGYANSVSKDFGIEFLDGRLWDESFVKNPKFVVITINDAPFDFTGAIMFNEPSALKIASGTSLAKSSPHSWLDVNHNDRRDIIKDEEGNIEHMEGFQEYDIMAESTRSEVGRALFISDSSLFINDMLGRKDNKDFAMSIMDYLLPNGGEIIIDEGRHEDQNVLTNIQQEAFHIIVVSTTNNNFKLLTGVIVFLGMVIILVALSDPPELVHRQRIFKPNLDELMVNRLTARDSERVRKILVEKIRLTRGYSIEEFKALSLSDLEDIIDDDELMDFIAEKNRRYTPEQLKAMLSAAKEWGEDVE